VTTGYEYACATQTTGARIPARRDLTRN
jgi:hypothetical protein